MVVGVVYLDAGQSRTLITLPLKPAMDKRPPGPNPGLIWCNSKIVKPEQLSKETFSKWYSDKHVPGTISTGHIHEAYRYESIDPKPTLPSLLCTMQRTAMVWRAS